MSLVAHLYQSDKPKLLEATQSHEFLRAASSDDLPQSVLAFWLAQDKVYASYGYPKFIGSLLSKLPPTHVIPDLKERKAQEAKIKHIRELLLFSLQNVRREIDFFDQQEKEWALRLDRFSMRTGTTQYLSAMEKIGQDGTLEEGLVFLWAMEKIYLDAWTRIHTCLSKSHAPDSALLRFSENWSCPEFVQFVDDLVSIVDSLDIGSDMKPYEKIWNMALEIEQAFWPSLEEV